MYFMDQFNALNFIKKMIHGPNSSFSGAFSIGKKIECIYLFYIYLVHDTININNPAYYFFRKLDLINIM